jgi:hypothetical protein
LRNPGKPGDHFDGKNKTVREAAPKFYILHFDFQFGIVTAVEACGKAQKKDGIGRPA